MKTVLFLLLALLALLQPAFAPTGTISLEGGIIAGIIISLATVIAIGIGFAVCMVRNDLLPCFGGKKGAEQLA